MVKKKPAKKAPAKKAKKAKGRGGPKQQPLWMECETIVDAAVEQIRQLVLSRIKSGEYEYRNDCEELFDDGLALGNHIERGIAELAKEAGELLPYEDADDEAMTPEGRAEQRRQFDEANAKMNSPKGQAETARMVKADRKRHEELLALEQKSGRKS
jgi:hypothetical protein